VAVSNADSEVYVYLGRGDGSLAPAHRVAVGTGPVDLVAADLNGDGKTDLATANDWSNSTTVLLSECR
jgi:hypothetical protein